MLVNFEIQTHTCTNGTNKECSH